jgi:hypothetical protein
LIFIVVVISNLDMHQNSGLKTGFKILFLSSPIKPIWPGFLAVEEDITKSLFGLGLFCYIKEIIKAEFVKKIIFILQDFYKSRRKFCLDFKLPLTFLFPLRFLAESRFAKKVDIFENYESWVSKIGEDKSDLKDCMHPQTKIEKSWPRFVKEACVLLVVWI